jgi:hypothetical protein
LTEPAIIVNGKGSDLSTVRALSRINTLPQNGRQALKELAIIVNGKGSDLSNSKAWKGKAKRKRISQKWF